MSRLVVVVVLIIQVVKLTSSSGICSSSEWTCSGEEAIFECRATALFPTWSLNDPWNIFSWASGDDDDDDDDDYNDNIGRPKIITKPTAVIIRNCKNLTIHDGLLTHAPESIKTINITNIDALTILGIWRESMDPYANQNMDIHLSDIGALNLLRGCNFKGRNIHLMNVTFDFTGVSLLVNASMDVHIQRLRLLQTPVYGGLIVTSGGQVVIEESNLSNMDSSYNCIINSFQAHLMNNMFGYHPQVRVTSLLTQGNTIVEWGDRTEDGAYSHIEAQEVIIEKNNIKYLGSKSLQSISHLKEADDLDAADGYLIFRCNTIENLGVGALDPATNYRDYDSITVTNNTLNCGSNSVKDWLLDVGRQTMNFDLGCTMGNVPCPLRTQRLLYAKIISDNTCSEGSKLQVAMMAELADKVHQVPHSTWQESPIDDPPPAPDEDLNDSEDLFTIKWILVGLTAVLVPMVVILLIVHLLNSCRTRASPKGNSETYQLIPADNELDEV